MLRPDPPPPPAPPQEVPNVEEVRTRLGPKAPQIHFFVAYGRGRGGAISFLPPVCAVKMLGILGGIQMCMQPHEIFSKP